MGFCTVRPLIAEEMSNWTERIIRKSEYCLLRLRRPAMTRIGLLLLLTLPSIALGAESRDSKVINDRADVLSAGRWTYNDLPKGFAEAKRTGKPLLVVLRCVP